MTSMKTLHLSIVVILITVMVASSNVFAQVTGPPPNDLGNGSLLSFKTTTTSFVPGGIIEIQGNSLPNSIVSLVLLDPNGITRGSKSTFSDRDGQFSTILKIPTDASGGTWKITGKSDNYQNEIEFNILMPTSGQTQYCCIHTTNQTKISTNNTNSTHGIYYGSSGPPIIIKIQSPLQQMRHGGTTKDITCWQGFQLILKAEDDSPACVKPDTKIKLIERGWAQSFTK